MKRGKWIAATMALAIVLSAGAFADSHPRDDAGRDGQAAYTQRDSDDRAQTWNNGYYDNGYRDRDDYRARDGYSQERDRDARRHDHDRDRGRDHDRRDRRDRDRDAR